MRTDDPLQTFLRGLIPAMAILGATIASTPASAVPGYTATPVPPLDGVATVGFSINAAGQIAGATGGTGSSNRHAFIYANGVTHDLGPIGPYAEVRGISDRGEVTGSTETASGALHAVVYAEGTRRDLGTLGGTSSIGTGILADGRVVGTSLLPGNVASRAFVHVAGTMHDLGTLGGPSSEATAINARGEIAGTSTTVDRLTRAFLYSGGTLHNLGTLPGGGNSYGMAINSRGEVAGYAFTSDGIVHAFVYSGETMRDLGTLPGGSDSIANGINAVGQIVGGAGIDGRGHAFLDVDGTMHDLNALVLSGIGPEEILTNAMAINDSGQIVALASSASGLRTYRLDPVIDVPVPLPATHIPTLSPVGLAGTALLLLAGGALAFRRRGRSSTHRKHAVRRSKGPSGRTRAPALTWRCRRAYAAYRPMSPIVFRSRSQIAFSSSRPQAAYCFSRATFSL